MTPAESKQASDRAAQTAVMLVAAAMAPGKRPVLDLLVDECGPDVDLHMLVGCLIGIAHVFAEALDRIDPGSAGRLLGRVGLQIAKDCRA